MLADAAKRDEEQRRQAWQVEEEARKRKWDDEEASRRARVRFLRISIVYRYNLCID